MTMGRVAKQRFQTQREQTLEIVHLIESRIRQQDTRSALRHLEALETLVNKLWGCLDKSLDLSCESEMFKIVLLKDNLEYRIEAITQEGEAEMAEELREGLRGFDAYVDEAIADLDISPVLLSS